DTPNAYAASWGLPAKAARRHHLIEAAYGNAPFEDRKGLEAGQHRDIEVLMLYPLSLVACRERFGSWMTQYGYAHYITAEKLLQYGKIDRGAIDVRGRRYTTVCALYETIPPAGLIEFLREFLASGGRVIWSGPPALVDLDGTPLLDRWREIFGIESVDHAVLGLDRPGRRVEFEGTLSGLEPQTILTDLPVDCVYPIHPAADASDGTEILARCDGQIVGWRRGQAAYLGFRPRDDQSASLGYETRVWFDALRLLGAYPNTKEPNDNPTIISRRTPYLATTFPNGAVAVTKHYHRHRETWSGGFHRNADEDAKALEDNPLDSNELELENFAVAGWVIDYKGKEIVALRCDTSGRPIAFYGEGTDRIAINGKVFIFTEQPCEKITFYPVPEDRRVAGGALYEIRITGPGGKVHLPIEGTFTRPRLFHRLGLGSLGGERPVTLEDSVLTFDNPEGATAYYLLDDHSAS
ncbi:MAG: hypothetical protein J6S75_14300, partial [Thermoguttaceae bacterium]|nr:hypothetical protein [Thermoguttaceae bacterium]